MRPVVIYYYLKDDSMCIVEPTVKNSGLIQGKRLKRQRLTKNERGDLYLWKDLNLGIDLEVHGFKYHIIGCDDFTKVPFCSPTLSQYVGKLSVCLLLSFTDNRSSWKVRA